MRSLTFAIFLVAALVACTKKNPMSDRVGALNSEIETSAPQSPSAEIEKPVIELAREGVAFEVLREDCFKAANDANLLTEEAEAICLNANGYSQNCLEVGLNVSLLKSSIAIICANAREGSASCLHEARIKDQKFSEEIADLCK